jgi:hypothetical protein
MTTGKATQPERRSKVQRLRNLFSRSRADSNQTTSPSPSAAESIPPKPTSSIPPTAQSSSSSRGSDSDPGGSSARQCPPATNTLGQDLLNKALERLRGQERDTIKEYILSTSEDINSALRDALTAAQEKQILCESKRWTFSIRGHSVSLREEADKVIRWLNKFKQVGDIVVNVDPIHAGLPWAGIRLLLEVWKD